MVDKIVISARCRAHRKLVRRALKASGGSQTRLAEAMGGNVRQGHITQWLSGPKCVSPHSAVLMENAVSCAVRREQFYPELYEGMSRTEPAATAPLSIPQETPA
jgi:DNA-binding transcriptional regulator YdaS (Cro superfamily)